MQLAVRVFGLLLAGALAVAAVDAQEKPSPETELAVCDRYAGWLRAQRDARELEVIRGLVDPCPPAAMASWSPACWEIERLRAAAKAAPPPP